MIDNYQIITFQLKTKNERFLNRQMISTQNWSFVTISANDLNEDSVSISPPSKLNNIIK